jgi:uncharacterized protein YdhG (YjbR/CyaY superfamily)
MAKSKPTNFNEYLQLVPEQVQLKLKELEHCILQVVPNATSTMNYGVPANNLIKGGKMHEQIMIAGFKNQVGLYPHPTTIKHFKDQLENFQTSKGTVRFELDKPLPKELIIAMVRHRKQKIDLLGT